ncbi:MAG TPA: hypothetical protein VGO93_25365 [Candidatus Xenobia bacterium]|jgi:hypothetical protein
MDPMQPQSNLFPPPRRRSGCLARGCTGCSLGCAGLLALIFFGLLFLMRWFMAQHSVTPAACMIGPDDRDFMVAHFDSQDPGVAAVISHIWEEFRYAQPGAPPRPSGSGSPNAAEIDQERGIAALLPRLEMAVKKRPGDSSQGHDEVTFVSLPLFHWPPMLLELARHEAPPSHVIQTYRNLSIDSFENTTDKGQTVTSYYVVDGGNVIKASSLALAKESVDRLLGPSGAYGGPDDIKPLYDEVDSKRPVVGVDSHQRTMRETLESIQGKDSFFPLSEDEIDLLVSKSAHLAYSLDFMDADTITFNTVFVASDPDDVAAMHDLLAKKVAELTKAGKLKDASTRASGLQVITTFKTGGMSKRIDDFFKALKQDEAAAMATGSPSPTGSPSIKTDTDVQ